MGSLSKPRLENDYQCNACLNRQPPGNELAGFADLSVFRE